MVKTKTDLTGQKFGRLTVIRQAEDYIEPKSGRHKSQWLCKCDCGNETVVSNSNLTKKNGIKSCGCLRKEFAYNLNKSYNTYDLSGEYGIGYTLKGEEFYFDLEDYDKIKNYCWRIHNKGYVACSVHKTKSIKKDVLMHVLVMGCYNNNFEQDKHMEIDHKHGKKSRCDNRKDNLRICTHRENMLNIGLRSNNTSGATGVHFDKRQKKWIARIIVNGKRVILGKYNNFEDAKRKRMESEKLHYGEFSPNNNI